MEDIFIIMEFILCDDYYYGYDERLHSVYGSYEDAKTFVDTFSDTKKDFYNGKDAFIRNKIKEHFYISLEKPIPIFVFYQET